MKDNLLTYYLMLSQTFPATHPRKGEETFFKEQTLNTIFRNKGYFEPFHIPSPIRFKIHTLRDNYDLWEKRFEKIYAGKACLSLRRWSGIPFRSEMIEIARLTVDDGIGLQRLEFEFYNDFSLKNIVIDGEKMCPPLINIVHQIAQNDGLTFADWKDWMYGMEGNKKYLQGTYAIIHFTKFRY